MKKYFIIAVAAIAAMAACSKVETADNTPGRKIAFEVANYASQTKAAEDAGSVLAETDNFSSKAWLHANGAATGADFFGTSANNYVETVLMDIAYKDPNDETIAAIEEARSMKPMEKLDVDNLEGFVAEL